MAANVAQRERSNIKCYVSAFSNILIGKFITHVFLSDQNPRSIKMSCVVKNFISSNLYI